MTLANFSLTHKLPDVAGTVGTNQPTGGKGKCPRGPGDKQETRESNRLGKGVVPMVINGGTHLPKGIQIQIKIKTQTALTFDSRSCFLAV